MWPSSGSNNFQRAKSLSSSLKFEPFADLFLALGLARGHTCIMRRGGNIYLDLSLLVLLCNKNFMNKLKVNDFY